MDKVLARDWKLEINTGTTELPVLVEVKSMKSLKFSGKKKDADTTDFDSNGTEEHMVASRSKSLGVECNYLEDGTTKDRDPGQEEVETLAEAVGPASLKQFVLTSPAGIKRTFTASVEIGDMGGKSDDPTNFNFDLTVSGLVVKS